MVAPVTIGDGAVTGAGPVISKDVPAGSLAVERTEQRNVKGYRKRKDAQHRVEGSTQGRVAVEIITKKRMMLYSGTIHPTIAHEIADNLGIPVSQGELRRFASGEIYFRADESVRGADVFVVQSHFEPINEAIMEQVIIIDAMKRASAKRITAVVPYYGYSRQDKKTLSREPISAKLVADMLRVAGADRIVSVDLHSGQIQGYFDGPFDHLTALPLISTYLKDELGLSGDDLVVVAPDAGRIKTSEKLREYLHADLAYIYKRRSRHEAHKISEMRLVYEEDIEGRPCVMVDDMIHTAGTLVQGVNVLAAWAPARSTPVRRTRSSRARPARPSKKRRSRR